MPSLADAQQLVVSGASAGGMAALLHVDDIAAAVRAKSPTVDVSVVAFSGFFVDMPDTGGNHSFAQMLRDVSVLHGASGGVQQADVGGCGVTTSPADASPWRCLLPQYFFPAVRARSFIVGSKSDPTHISLGSGVALQQCAFSEFCSSTQQLQFSSWATTYVRLLQSALRVTPAGARAGSGGFISSCAIHTYVNRWTRHVAIQNVTIYDALVAWFQQNRAPERSRWYLDGMVRRRGEGRRAARGGGRREGFM